MKQTLMILRENKPLNDSVWRMILEGDTSGITAPGQFVNLKLEGLFLRRPISVCDRDGDTLTLVYKVVGQGTEKMTTLKPGERVDTLTGLGNGYDLTKAGEAPVLLGGGVGIPPLYGLAKELKKQGKSFRVVLGFNTGKEVFMEEAFRALTEDTVVTTVDGSRGVKGFVTNALPEDYTYFYTCGPLPMLKAVCRATKTGGQLSMEERMGCGFGACMGCTVNTVNGPKRICKDGPVLEKEEILWED